ncbi:MAG: enoyl-CoA hydratase/isomerase family protein [Candidatus Marinimicrobia bacterium]|nr:enoyl-CoA hydratase/isomerase family protein [Candidatus Neomarinimicrobiota bacterium]MBT3634132.1 enoyl-CoA hydratase/isomerase family protein [Candidatus Neomarinimicrobiota bacterium]MBT3683169.1 enoyl-CoA hydratase/isomerase family protein [Candidatus Neomarinimicrobiota bacterium]MBT3759783.1 enoyl-CoA hydratase/isomerase family protein [Candidatus Neomarinimicrobiota bacterium]MBT3895811.1 enoyl-CoA hydratase/isomerase family protein [Candidatus Neomarinimicrobiota bacterium]
MNHGTSNAFDLELIECFNKCLDDIDNSRPLYIIGKERFFSSGLNLVEMQKLNSQDFDYFINQFQDLLFRILTYPNMVTALINGHAVAGGFILSCACDVRYITSSHFKIGMNEKQMNISLPPVPMAILKTVFGNQINRILNQVNFLTPDSDILSEYFYKTKYFELDKLINSQIYKEYKSKHQTFRQEKVEAIKRYLSDNQIQIMKEFSRSWWTQEAVNNRNDIIYRLKLQ